MIQVSNARRLTAACVIAASLSACVVAPARPYYATATVVTVVTVEPPAPRVEYVGTPPVQGYVWLGGYWGWEGGRHVWVNCCWDAPHVGYHWAPHVWVREGGGWRLREVHWDRG